MTENELVIEHLEEIFSNHHEEFVNWMQSKGWRDNSLAPQMPDAKLMEKWRRDNIASQEIYVEEARVKKLRADFELKQNQDRLEDLKANREMF